MTGWKVGIDGCKAGWFYLASNDAETKLGHTSTLRRIQWLVELVSR